MANTNTAVNPINQIVGNDFLSLVREDASAIIKYNDQKKALELSQWLSTSVRQNRTGLRKHKEALSFFNRIIVKVRFVSLPLLDNRDVISLFKNYFTWQFRIEGYDLMNKFNLRLVNIEVLEDRDVLKKELKSDLLNNQSVITSDSVFRTIADWLRDYNAKLGAGLTDNLKRGQYMIDLKKVVGLDEFDLKKLKILFDFYEELKLSSLSPEGFNEEVPISIDGKSYIFRRGVLEPIKKTKLARVQISPQEAEVEATVAEEEQNIVESEEPKALNEGTINPLESLAIEEEELKEKEIKRLNDMAATFKKGSLERKAIEQEIKRMER